MRRAAAAIAALALALAGCGGDDEEKRDSAGGGQESAARTTPEPRPDKTAPGTAPDKPDSTDKKPAPGGGTPSPEDQPGGAGDEEPAVSQALLTGKGGRVRPRLVRVTPYISVRVELRSGDGRDYSLQIHGHMLGVSGGLVSTSTTLDGLRPGRAYVGRAGDGGRVRIEASAEPGP